MNVIPTASELLETKVNEWRRLLDNHISQHGFFRDDEKGALLFEITPELLSLLTGLTVMDLKSQKIFEVALGKFHEYMTKYAENKCEYDIKYCYHIRPGTSKIKPYFVATAIRIWAY